MVCKYYFPFHRLSFLSFFFLGVGGALHYVAYGILVLQSVIEPRHQTLPGSESAES